jgi:hypothetical protein
MAIMSNHHYLVLHINKQQAEKGKLEKYVEWWRERLMDISWFIRRLNETISRKANEEDGCTGHF